MTESKICTCPSGDGSLRWPCPAHPAVDQADVAAKLTFINGRPAMCGCQVEYSDGGGEYSDVIYVTLCAKHSGSAILDLVATNRIALTPEYEGQWHADLYLDREIPLAKVEGATPAEAVLALMSAERIDPEQESVEQASGDERAAFEAAASKLGIYTCNFQRYTEETAAHENRINARVEDPVRVGDYRSATLHDCWKIWQEARAALAQPSPVRSSLLINGYQLRAALDFIAPDGTAEQLESEACIEWRQQDADFLEAGLYAWGAEYPEEGCVLLDEEPTNSQPSPAQAEQAEAERPEMSPERAAYFMRRFKSEEKLLGPNEQAAVDYVLSLLAQHDRIVGELRAKAVQLREALEWRAENQAGQRELLRSVKAERDAALAIANQLHALLNEQA
ncbi:hypothetical protein ACXW1K_001583 [Pseudomonas aeruginosa]|uniref:hypothetical protein n=3 Tax=Pseudomonas aeruginosa TaxID=287 RepID=UPI001A32AB0F|nr:hypothetical protein [Pseudomonas aeruginosa]MBH3773788.1 hypothetical protein [Pseudomonas aeruginosa]MBH9148641.1 hypothetical protein [Pseudomonas aeruginosa]MDP5951884.1 hypothetical protein [Pseudomonas aeruginosa]MDP5963083.1 hypothetical protein [Pseudomonas aeruginosa]